ncbi:MAG: SpoIIIAH-like family protein [Clostridia bacterium]|nr:SpoIIIAH-like family protein [Clostridia bacterium]
MKQRSRHLAARYLRLTIFLVLVAAAVGYVRWKWDDFQRATLAVLSPAGPAGGASPRAVGGPVPGAPSASGIRPPTGVETGGDGREGFFALARLERDRLASQQEELLRSLVAGSEVAPELRAQAQQQVLALAARRARQVEAESLLRAKGFADALVYAYEGSAIVIVRSDALTPAAVARVADIVASVTGVPAQAVRVMARSR